MRKRLHHPDQDIILKEAIGQIASPARRRFLTGSLTLGGLTLLTGCDLTNSQGVETALERISRFNDKAQAWLFDPKRLAPTYAESMMTRPFPFNAFYGLDRVPRVDADSFRLEVSGLVADRHAWTLAELRALPQTDQVTRHICVEGWSAIGKWGGVPFHVFLKRIGADLTAQYVGFKCADGYHTSIDMPTALHPQTQLTLTYDSETLPARYGFPMKIRIPTKLGYKNPKHVQAIFVTNSYPGGYWEDQGYNWFGGS
ncbi:molybdopterin-dependent oxidoreductase [Thiocystis violacea]|uniref:molybdopterin-dependent oxidoreductase n=1 Tax=Thiocystis violacea TaxID=13725 RepID=UPI001902C25E|nr:molybdopterin-dependent oxidoreductase [Thiocystis violacea]MBK1721206.1 molybdopterin-binding protein [Thiocystis violacea]